MSWKLTGISTEACSVSKTSFEPFQLDVVGGSSQCYDRLGHDTCTPKSCHVRAYNLNGSLHIKWYTLMYTSRNKDAYQAKSLKGVAVEAAGSYMHRKSYSFMGCACLKCDTLHVTHILHTAMT